MIIIFVCVIVVLSTTMSCKHGEKYPRGLFYHMISNSDPGVQMYKARAFDMPRNQDVMDIMYDFVPNGYLGRSNFHNFERFHNGVSFPIPRPLMLSSFPFKTLFPDSRKSIQKNKDETLIADQSETKRKDDSVGNAKNKQRKKRSSSDVWMSGNGNIKNEPESRLAFEEPSDIQSLSTLMALNAHSFIEPQEGEIRSGRENINGEEEEAEELAKRFANNVFEDITHLKNSRGNLRHTVKGFSTRLDEPLRLRLDDIKKHIREHKKIQSSSHHNHNHNRSFKSGIKNKLSMKKPAWTSAYGEEGYTSPTASHHALHQGYYPHFLQDNSRHHSFDIHRDAPILEYILAVSPSSDVIHSEIPHSEEFHSESHIDLIKPGTSESSHEAEVPPLHSIHQISHIGKHHSGFPGIRKHKHEMSGFGAHTSQLLSAPESYVFQNTPNGINSNVIPLCQQCLAKRLITNIPHSIPQWIPPVRSTGFSNPQMMHLEK